MTAETSNIRYRDDLPRRVIEIDLESDRPYDSMVFDECARGVGNAIEIDLDNEYQGLKYIVLGGKLYAFNEYIPHSEVQVRLARACPGELLSAGYITVIHYKGYDKRVLWGSSSTLALSPQVSGEFRNTTLRDKLGSLFDINVRFDAMDMFSFYSKVDSQVDSR